MVRRPNVDVARGNTALYLAGHCLRLRNLLRLEPLSFEHVLEVHIAAEVQLVCAVKDQAPVLEQASQDPVGDRRT